MDSGWIFIAAIIVIVLLLIWGVPCSAEPEVQESTTVITTPAGTPVAVVKTAVAVAAGTTKASTSPLLPKETANPVINGGKRVTLGFKGNYKSGTIEQLAVGVPQEYERIRSADGSCMTITGSELSTQPCSVTDVGQWWKAPASKKLGYLLESKTGSCVGRKANGEAVMVPCDDNPNQQWTITDLEAGPDIKLRRIESNGSGREAPGCLTDTGGNLKMLPCNKKISQEWKF